MLKENDLLNLQARVEYLEFVSGKNSVLQTDQYKNEQNIKLDNDTQTDNGSIESIKYEDNGSLSDKLKYCYAQFSRVERAPYCNLLFKKYDQLEKILNSKDINELDIHGKSALLLAIEDEYREIYKQTQIIDAHQQFLNTEIFQEIPQLHTQLKPLQQIHLDQVEASNQVNTELEALLNSYNDTINIISQKFLYWDSVLTNLEEKVNKVKS